MGTPTADELLAGLSPEERAEAIAYAREQCWRDGDLSWKLDDDQQADSEKLWSVHDDFMAAISRQRGKSHWACVEALAFGLRFPGCGIGYVAKTLKHTNTIVEPRFRTILTDCPEDIRPEFDTQKGFWTFPNGSRIYVAGTDNKHYEKLRGPTLHFLVKDEAGFFDDYEEVDAAVAPTLTTTRGICLEISSPPETVGHPFESRFRAAQGRGRFAQRSIYGHPRMTPEEVETFIAKEAGKRAMSVEEFKRTTYFRREFLAEFVTEETRAVVPGWNQEREKECVREYARPEFFDGYVGLDLGFGDPHAALFAFVDFAAHKLVVEDELLLRHANTEKLADALKAKEAEVWGSNKWAGTLRGARDVLELPEYLQEATADGAPPQPYLRVGDNDPLALADLQQKHRLTFLPTAKDEKHLQLDLLDILVRRGDIVIHPRCKGLIRQLYTTVWNRPRTSYERAAGEHGDLIDALVYLVRNVRWHKDPRPPGYGVRHDDTWRRPGQKQKHPLAAMLAPRR